MTTTTELPANAPCWCGSGRKYKRCHRVADLDQVSGDVAPLPPRGERVVPGVVGPTRTVPDSIVKPSWALGLGMPPRDPGAPRSEDVIRRMRVAGRVAAEAAPESRLAILRRACAAATAAGAAEEPLQID